MYARLPWLVERLGARLGSVEHVPLPPLASPGRRAEWRVGLVTAAGVHGRDEEPFDMTAADGDPTIRILPGAPAAGTLRITHDYYDHSEADRDVNCVLPVERLHELAAAGAIGEVAPRHVSFMGHLTGAALQRFVRESLSAIAAPFAQAGVDVVVASPG